MSGDRLPGTPDGGSDRPGAHFLTPLAPPTALSPVPLARWGDRVLAALVDLLYQLPAVLVHVAGAVLFVANTEQSTGGRTIRAGNPPMAILGAVLIGLSFLVIVGVGLYAHVIVQGQQGQTWGKRRLGLRLVRADSGELVGTGSTLVRELAHVLDVVLLVGFLRPLWHPQRQTFADTLLRTVVVRER